MFQVYQKASLTLFLSVALLGLGSAVANPSLPQFPKVLPEFTLKDVHDKSYESAKLKETDLIIVVTAPTLRNKKYQEGWDKYLDYSRDTDKVMLVFVEDMVPSAFKSKAKRDMAKDSKPD